MPDENPDHDMRTHKAASPCAICGRATLVGCVSGWLPTWNTLNIRGIGYRMDREGSQEDRRAGGGPYLVARIDSEDWARGLDF